MISINRTAYTNSSHTIDKITFKNQRGFLDYVDVVPSPTSNCQMMSIGMFYKLIYYQEEKNILKQIFKQYSKSLVLIDIERYLVKKTLKIFENDKIIIKENYKNTNTNSKMCLLLINVENWL